MEYHHFQILNFFLTQTTSVKLITENVGRIMKELEVTPHLYLTLSGQNAANPIINLEKAPLEMHPPKLDTILHQDIIWQLSFPPRQ